MSLSLIYPPAIWRNHLTWKSLNYFGLATTNIQSQYKKLLGEQNKDLENQRIMHYCYESNGIVGVNKTD